MVFSGCRRGGWEAESGFVLTLELLLLASIFLIVLIGGLALLRDHLAQMARERMWSSVLVVDSQGRLIGRARGFDAADAPRVLIREPESRVALLLSVHTTRFASRQAVFFDQAGCQGTAYLQAPYSGTGPISELGALQRRSYGVGPRNELYLTPPDQLPGAPRIASRWVSERGDLCEGLAPVSMPGLLEAQRVLSLGEIYEPPYSVPIPEPYPAADEPDALARW